MSLKMLVSNTEYYNSLIELLQKRQRDSDKKLRRTSGELLLQEQGRAQELEWLLQLKDKVNKDQV